MTDWRLKIIQANVSRGLQDPRDLEDVKAHGRVTRPTGNICLELAYERARELDAPKRKRAKETVA
jgi:hypothetical protein